MATTLDPSLEPTHGDNETRLAKNINTILYQQASSPDPTLAPSHGDNLFRSLRKANQLLYSNPPGGGGGITTETDPLSVHTTGGTMTGTLAITSSSGTALLNWQDTGAAASIKFDTGYAGNPTIEITNGTQTCQLSVDSSGLFYINPPGTSDKIILPPTCSIQWWRPGQAFIQMQQDPSANNDLIIRTSTSGSGIMFSNNAGSTGDIRLYQSSTGADLIATATVGPNAGKSVNLTTGKWA